MNQQADDTCTDSSKVFERLCKRCPKFRQALQTQQDDGIGKKDWNRWVRLLIYTGHPEAASAFSGASFKHDEKSEQYIVQMIDDVEGGTGPMVRCTTFGCSLEQIEKCFHTVNLNDKREATNSPGFFIRDMNRLLPPLEPIYRPYVQTLATVRDYKVDEHGKLCTFDRKGAPVEIANFVAKPMKEIIRDDGVCEDRTFRIEGILSGGHPLPAVDVPATEFPGMSWVMKHWGFSPNIRAGQSKKDQCRDAIQVMAGRVDQHRIYTHLGWRKLPNGRWIYLHSTGCIGAENISVEIEEILQNYSLPLENKSPKRNAQASLSLMGIAPREITMPMYALVYLSPLVEPLKRAGIEPNFLLWLNGRTGSRKTSLSLAFLSHFGRFTRVPPASFKDTVNALERKAFATKDTLLLVDDYHPAKSQTDARELEQTAQRLLRMYGDRIARGRLKSTIEFQREYPPRGVALVTGEDIPKGHSSTARFIPLEISPGDVDLNKLSKAQKAINIFAQSMTGYIKWLIPQMDTLPEQLSNQFYELRDYFQQKAEHGRLGEAAAWLQVGFRTMLSYMVDMEAITSEHSEQLASQSEAILGKIVEKHGKAVDRENPAKTFVKVLSDLFATGKVFVKPLHPSSSDHSISGEMIGWFDHNFYYLLSGPTYQHFARFLAARSEAVPLSERTLWKQLDEAKMIFTEGDKDGKIQRLPKKKIPFSDHPSVKQTKDNRLRLIHLHRNVLEMASDEEG
ncbi:hypothetical protein [uncultured Brevibacillus sp.]|uniref:hypothetical protein n=1 Tax=uncultured Brevibacillus sp. TaxID=169970 RepID=UPI002598C2A5|nr:hypothetical protein [uncultured Brevibacillus sp.]